MIHADDSIYYDNMLLVATSKQTGGIYFSSTKATEFNKLADEFKEKYPNSTNDVVYWYSYVDTLLPTTAFAIEHGATTFKDIIDYSHGQRSFVHEIYKVVVEYYNEIKVYHCSTLKKAKIKANDVISKEDLNHIYCVYIIRVELDTDKQDVHCAYMKDNHGRMAKEQNMELVNMNFDILRKKGV